MKDTIFYLGTCDTCKRIMGQINDIDRFELREIKSKAVSSSEIEEIYNLSELSYSELFNKRARKYKEIKDQLETADDKEYKSYITQEYTFLKRPVIVYQEQVFAGNAKKTIEQMLNSVHRRLIIGNSTMET